MNKKLFNVLLFTAGAAIGSVVTWRVVKARYERIVQEEIESVKETWARMNREDDDSSVVDDNDEDEDEDEDASDDEDVDPVMIDYYKLANKYKGSDDKIENSEEGGGDDEVPYINGPYVITPNDFGDGNYDHDTYYLTYYSDGVLSNDWYEKLDVDETIGQDSIEHFGEYAEDNLHVRNERLKADYEIVRDCRKYADMIANDPLMHMHAN